MNQNLRGPWRLLYFTFFVVCAGFVSATLIANASAGATEESAWRITHVVVPRIEAVARARTELLHLADRADDELDPVPGPDDTSLRNARRRELKKQVEAYLRTGTDAPMRDDLKGQLGRVLDLTGDDALDAQVTPGARQHTRQELQRAVEQLDASFETSLTANADDAQDLADQVQRRRASSRDLALVLDALCTVLALVAAGFVVTASRRHARLLEENSRLQAERAAELEAFAGRVAHDVLSPLSPVAMLLDLEARQGLGGEAWARPIGNARASIRRIDGIVRGLLEFARAGAQPHPGARAALPQVLAGVVADSAEQAQEKGVALRLEDPPHVAVACDPGLLTSVVSNLLSNAIKYIGEGGAGRVVLAATATAGRVRLTVADNGPGIPAALRERIFEPYVRASDKAPGIGLGLATVKKVVEAHGGAVGVDSRVGVGSTFWVELPLAPPDVDARQPVSAPAPAR